MTERALAHMQRARECLQNEHEALQFGVRAPQRGQRTVGKITKEGVSTSCADIITAQVGKKGYSDSSIETFLSRLHYCALDHINIHMKTFMHLIKKYSVFKSDEDYARRYESQLRKYRELRDAIQSPVQKALSADIDHKLNLVDLGSVHDMLISDEDRPDWVLSKDGLELAVLNFAYGKKDSKATILFAHPTSVKISSANHITESGAKHAPLANMLDEQYITGTIALMSCRKNTMKRLKMFVSPQSGIWLNKKLSIMQNWSTELPTIRQICKWFPNNNGTETENLVLDILDIFAVALISEVIARKFSFIDISNCLVYRILENVAKHMTLNETYERFCENAAARMERFCNIDLGDRRGSQLEIARLLDETADHKDVHQSRSSRRRWDRL